MNIFEGTEGIKMKIEQMQGSKTQMASPQKKTKQGEDQTSARTTKLFDKVWLLQYPCPRKVLYDNGSEFKKSFQPLLKDFTIKPTCTLVKNPQSNAILECIHQVVGSMLKTNNLAATEFDLIDLWGEIFASIAYAVRCSFHSTLRATPGQLVFGRDMLCKLTLAGGSMESNCLKWLP